MIKRLLSTAISALLLISLLPLSAAAQNFSVSLLCDSGQRSTFSAPYSSWVLVRDASGAPAAGQELRITVTGPATLVIPQGMQSNAQGYVNYTVMPNLGAVPQDITVTASLVGSDRSISCKSSAQPNLASNVRVTLEAPKTALPGTSLVYNLTVTLLNGTPMQRIPIEWTVFGPGLQFGATQTDAQGQAKMTLLLSTADQGTVSVAAKLNFGSYTSNSFSGATQITNTEPIPAVDTEIYSSEGKVHIVVKDAKGAAVSVKIGSTWFRYTATSDVHTFTRTPSAPEQSVAVYVNGQLENVATLSFPDFVKPTATPKPTPTQSSNPGASAPSRTITCKSGTKILSVTGSSPSCPKGFTRSGTPMPAGAKVVVCKKPGFVIRMAAPMTTCPAGYKK